MLIHFNRLLPGPLLDVGFYSLGKYSIFRLMESYLNLADHWYLGIGSNGIVLKILSRHFIAPCYGKLSFNN